MAKKTTHLPQDTRLAQRKGVVEPLPKAMGYKVWACKIVIPDSVQIPEGFDSPPRRAAMSAVLQHGIPVLTCFSGWDGTLSQEELHIVDRTNDH